MGRLVLRASMPEPAVQAGRLRQDVYYRLKRILDRLIRPSLKLGRLPNLAA